MDRPKKELVIISGFLGAGKTTLINHLLRDADGVRFGLIVNDFGKIVVDAERIRDEQPGAFPDGSRIIEIAQGSIFCSCLESAFRDGLRYYADRGVDRVLVETSGVSDPSSMGNILDADPVLAAAYRLGRRLTVVDAVRFEKVVRTLAAVKRQLMSATHVVVNKTDVAGDEQTAAVCREAADINPRARVIRAVRAAVDWDTVSDRGEAPACCRRDTCNTPDNRPASLFFPQAKVERRRLERFLAMVTPYIWRVKGYYRLEDGVFYLSDGGRNWSLERDTASRDRSLGLVVICPPDSADQVRAAWRTATGQETAIN